MKIMRGEGVFRKRESLLIFENNIDFNALGVGGRNIPKMKINTNMKTKSTILIRNFFTIDF